MQILVDCFSERVQVVRAGGTVGDPGRARRRRARAAGRSRIGAAPARGPALAGHAFGAPSPLFGNQDEKAGGSGVGVGGGRRATHLRKLDGHLPQRAGLDPCLRRDKVAQIHRQPIAAAAADAVIAAAIAAPGFPSGRIPHRLSPLLPSLLLLLLRLLLLPPLLLLLLPLVLLLLLLLAAPRPRRHDAPQRAQRRLVDQRRQVSGHKAVRRRGDLRGLIWAQAVADAR